MVAAHTAVMYFGPKSADGKKYTKRWHSFLFMFSCATLHELAHLFVCYLNKGACGHTPRQICYLDYGQQALDEASGQFIHVSESGRWLESVMYGGSIEFYRDPRDTAGQVSAISFISHVYTTLTKPGWHPTSLGLTKRLSAN